MPSDGAGPSNVGSELDIEKGEGIQTTPTGLPVGASQPQQQPVDSSQHQQPLGYIPKVREQLRLAASEYLFTPLTMMIGPYHQKEGFYSFTSTEEKKKAVQYLKSHGVDFVSLKRKLDTLGPQVKTWYSHLPGNEYGDPEVFSRMLLNDGCYLLKFFIEYKPPAGTAGRLQGDGGQQRIQTKDNTVVRDILYLIENQMPLFVLDKMHSIIIGNGAEGSSLKSIARAVQTLLQKQLYISNTERSLLPESTSSHLLHLVHSYFEVGNPQQVEEPHRAIPLTGRWRRATDYSKYADLQFKRRRFNPGDEWTILDIELRGGTLYIPLLRVSSSTWTMLRNMMALEEQLENRPVTAYCFFMSQLACKEADVDLLQRANIIEHLLGSDEQAAQGFAELCYGVALDMDKLERNYLKPIWHNLDKRCRKPVITVMGFFREEYWSNEFYRLAFCVTLFVFVCQVTQSVYAVLGYHKPPKA